MLPEPTQTILIDGMILAYRNYSSLGFLRTSTGESTGRPRAIPLGDALG